MQQGKLRKVGENGSSTVQRTNIIDTIGFCDSVFTPKQVLDVIKSSVKVNVCHIDKVVVVCSGRIEGQHAQAVQQFMKWLKYKKHRNQFVFVYNKADHCDGEEEKMENVKGMLELLGAKQVFNPIEGGGGADLPPLSRICVYARVYTYTRSNLF